MLAISEAQRRTELFLTGQMLEALRAVEYEMPSFDTELHDVDLAAVARARRDPPCARLLFSSTPSVEELLMQLQQRSPARRRLSRAGTLLHGSAGLRSRAG
jgi:hypothetical protein